MEVIYGSWSNGGVFFPAPGLLSKLSSGWGVMYSSIRCKAVVWELH